MINVVVSYTVNNDFVEQNKINIQKFLNDFNTLDQKAFRYIVFIKDDGMTFVHQSVYKNQTIQNEMLNVPSFKEFQRLRDESGLNHSHKVEVLTFIGSSGNLNN